MDYIFTYGPDIDQRINFLKRKLQAKHVNGFWMHKSLFPSPYNKLNHIYNENKYYQNREPLHSLLLVKTGKRTFDYSKGLCSSSIYIARYSCPKQNVLPIISLSYFLNLYKFIIQLLI